MSWNNCLSMVVLVCSTFPTAVLCFTTHHFQPAVAIVVSSTKQIKPPFGMKSLIVNSQSHDDLDYIQIPLVERLDLSSRFSRWKILQDILEEEDTPTAQDINELLFVILKSFLDNPRPLILPSGDTNPSPTLSNKQRQLLVDELFQYRSEGVANEESSIGYINAIPTDESGDDSMDYENEKIIEVYNLLENLHPDRDEDEDAFKGCWDLVMELYGKEATKHSEQSGDKCWKMRSSVVRLLIHYDFLVDGIVEAK